MLFRDKLDPEKFFGTKEEKIEIPPEKRSKVDGKDFLALTIAAFTSYLPIVLGVWGFFALVIWLLSLWF